MLREASCCEACVRACSVRVCTALWAVVENWKKRTTHRLAFERSPLYDSIRTHLTCGSLTELLVGGVGSTSSPPRENLRDDISVSDARRQNLVLCPNPVNHPLSFPSGPQPPAQVLTRKRPKTPYCTENTVPSSAHSLLLVRFHPSPSLHTPYTQIACTSSVQVALPNRACAHDYCRSI